MKTPFSDRAFALIEQTEHRLAELGAPRHPLLIGIEGDLKEMRREEHLETYTTFKQYQAKRIGAGEDKGTMSLQDALDVSLWFRELGLYPTVRRDPENLRVYVITMRWGNGVMTFHDKGYARAWLDRRTERTMWGDGAGSVVEGSEYFGGGS
jgi:hypothetical protein